MATKRSKLPYGQVYRTVEEVKKEIISRGHRVPSDWNQKQVVTGIGIYEKKEGILHYWLIGVSDDLPGR